MAEELTEPVIEGKKGRITVKVRTANPYWKRGNIILEINPNTPLYSQTHQEIKIMWSV